MAADHDTPRFFRWRAGTTNRRYARAVNDPGLHVTVINKDESSGVWESEPPEGILEVEGGSTWPDVLENTSLRGLYVAERIIEALDARWRSSFEAEQVTGVRSKCRAKPDEAPTYYRLTPKGSVELDFEASGLSRLKLDRDTGRILAGSLVGARDVIIPESWDGLPLCLCRRPLLPDRVFCTIDVIELARAQHWTNARFHPAGLPVSEQAGWQIDYLGRQWPPRWYPQRPAGADDPGALHHALMLYAHLCGRRSGETELKVVLKRLLVAGRERTATVLAQAYRDLPPEHRAQAAEVLGFLAKDAVKIPDALWQTVTDDQPDTMRKYDRLYRRHSPGA